MIKLKYPVGILPGIFLLSLIAFQLLMHNKCMSIGYACMTVGVPDTEIRSCTLKNASTDRLISLTEHNLDSLEKIIDYNISNGINLFRICSDLVPFGSSVALHLPWNEIFADKLSEISGKIIGSGMRVSMHPGQYTVLNSPDPDVLRRAQEDLVYHARVLDSLNVGSQHKIILHIGGAYGNKRAAIKQFLLRYANLDENIKNRLVIENDDSIFNIADVLEVSASSGIPVVFDNLHNSVNPADKTKPEMYWIKECSRTWRRRDGVQKIHYSQQNPQKRPGAHSDSVSLEVFIDFYQKLCDPVPDIMLEVKDKNISAVKCANCTETRGIGAFETEWSRYKYSVLGKSPAAYQSIRTLLNDKSSYPALEFYKIIEEALRIPEDKGYAINAAEHVWGYFKDAASDSEKKRYSETLKSYLSGSSSLSELKRLLKRLAVKYNEDYLLKGYYFLYD
jgi:UV DNA damage endonuclease